MQTLFFFVTHEDLQQKEANLEFVLLIISDRQCPAEYGTEDKEQPHDQINHLRPPPDLRDPPCESF